MGPPTCVRPMISPPRASRRWWGAPQRQRPLPTTWPTGCTRSSPPSCRSSSATTTSPCSCFASAEVLPDRRYGRGHPMTTPVRREPPPFRRLTVARVATLGPRMVRVTLGGAEMEGFPVPEPAASVRLLLPPSHDRELTMPAWNGNEFLLPDGT